MFGNIPTNSGLVRTVIVIVIALLVLSYYGFNLRNLAESPTTQDNFGYVTTFVLHVWNDYLKRPATYLWNDVFLDLIWNPAIENLQKIKDGQPDDLSADAPKVPDR